LEEWYRSKANIYFSRVFEECWHPFHKKRIDKPTLKIRNMKTRWGSLSRKGNLTLNLGLIKAPRECIEYVVIHELCHLFHPNHGAEFYNLLELMLPDWIKRKHKLEMALS
ncbi:MAG: M48 family metallopeptidase, partial [Gemmatimonadota bacterium]|nr:M48 family metallopeptidase [Gemmatimonadota bacterium]